MDQGLGYFLGHLIQAIEDYIAGMSDTDMIWLGIGLLGQSLFMLRFIVQWIHSERHQQSLIPVSFWYFSLVGGLTVLAYGIHDMDPVIILGQLPGTVVYARNLMLLRHAARENRHL
ncbi:lipid-A-disaccharide synthase N-terminal domain-containing protein [Methylobacillus flagellatus]|uniref:lipid-A-disaccharide synthase N-terminal domain-containing protein n=1 Tax=Methylobacillus flagellatus TaxID=405 RepID=UPI0010F7C402|nr:lipid-A-disaccharide synthase N-terminal domain-containing protein [Methylobacillus flagellatus]